jgi:hypothetical protein
MLKQTFLEMDSTLEIIYCENTYYNMTKEEVVQQLLLLPLVTMYRSEYYSIPGLGIDECTVFLN